ncbi:hypothetical protein ACFL9T_16875 [Thermodesulfobacteriota bacterium]
MKKTIAIFVISGTALVSILLLNYYWPRLDEPKFDRAITYTSSLVVQAIAEDLAASDMPFKMGSNLVIHYRSEDEQKIKAISGKHENLLVAKSPNISFKNKEDLRYFKELLEKATIPYEIRNAEKGGRIYVLWDEKDDNRVQELIMKVFNRIGVTTQPVRVNFKDKKKKEYFLDLLKEGGIPYNLVEDETTDSNSGPDITYDWKYHDTVRELRLQVQRYFEKGEAEGNVRR